MLHRYKGEQEQTVLDLDEVLRMVFSNTCGSTFISYCLQVGSATTA